MKSERKDSRSRSLCPLCQLIAQSDVAVAKRHVPSYPKDEFVVMYPIRLLVTSHSGVILAWRCRKG